MSDSYETAPTEAGAAHQPLTNEMLLCDDQDASPIIQHTGDGLGAAGYEVAADIAPATKVIIPPLSEDIDNLGAAIQYAAAGIYLLPVKKGTKHPGSRVGDRWQDKSSRNPQVIAAWFIGSSDGIAIDLGRSGLIVIDVDHPELLPEWLQTALAESGAPYQSTRPDAPGRGHYVFRQPEGRRIGCGKGRLAGMGLDVKGAGGVIIAQPTAHPVGGEYRWILTGEIPALPAELADKLGSADTRESAATDDEVQSFLDRHTSASKPQLLDVVVGRFTETRARNKDSRHDAMVELLPWALRDAMCGYYPARAASETLRTLFTAAYGGEGDRQSSESADSEFDGILAWAVGQLAASDPATLRAQAEARLAANSAARNDFSGIWTPREDAAVELCTVSLPENTERPSEAKPAPGVPNLIELEQDFWQSRDSLRLIYTVSLKRMCSPWAVLGCCVARVLAQIHPHIVLPDMFGEWGSLNWFGAIAARSGGGKGNANGLARRLVGNVPHTGKLGSGEGLVDKFWHIGHDDKGKRTLNRIYQVMVNANEIDNLATLGSRSGSTLMPTLRSAFNGEDLGFDNRKNKDTLPGVDAHTYRLTFLCSVQPGRAKAILGDADGGTPQRFMWLPAVDPRRTAEAYDRSYPVPHLTLPPLTAWQYRTEITIPEIAEREIIAAQEDDADADTLDGHAMFVREKFAFALAVLGCPEAFDGHGAEITEEDWQLSGIAAKVSTATRAWVAEGMADAERVQAAEAGSLYGHKLAAAKVAEADVNLKRDNRIAALIEKHLVKAADGGLTDRELHEKMASRDKPFWRAVAETMVTQDRITHTPSADSMKGKDIWRVVR